jgi:pimeloyl-ACP methyl ester carboxylesterase
MPYCPNREVRLYYEVRGRGPSLLLISGLGGGAWSWFAQVPFFQDFYRTIAFDHRGAGRSDMPPGPYRMADFAADALGLLDHLRVERASVAGVSLGGMVAQELALLAPDRVAALILGCTHCGAPERIPPGPGVIEVLAANEGLSPAEIIDKDLPYHFSREFLERQPEILAAYRQTQISAPPQPYWAFQAQLAAIPGFSRCGDLRSLALPALVVTGSEDVIVPPANARLLASLLPRAELAILPGAGHAVHVERADEFNALVHEFLQRTLSSLS